MADPLILTPGQIALPDDFRAVLQQHAAGGTDVKSVQPIPITDPKLKSLLAEDGLDLEQTPAYRYFLNDGTMIEAITQNDGQYRIIDYKPSTRFTQQHPANATAANDPNTPAGRDANELSNERSYNLANGGLYETHGERRAREQKEKETNQPKTTSRVVKGGDGKDYIQAVTAGPDGSIKSITNYDQSGRQIGDIPGERAKPAVQAAIRGGQQYTVVTTLDPQTNAPTIKTYGPDGQEVPGGLPTDAPKPGVQQVVRAGKTYTVVTSLDPTTNVPTVKTYGPDGQEVPGGLPPETKPTETVTRNGRTYEVVRDANGRVVEERAVPTTGGPRFSYPDLKFQYGQIAAEYGQIVKDVYGQVGRGEMTPDEAEKYLLPIHQQAEMRVSELNNIVSTQKSLYDTDVNWATNQQSTANTRLSASTNLLSQAGSMVKDAGSLLPGTGASAGKAFLAYLDLGRQYAQQMGGLRDVEKPAMPGYLRGAYEQQPGAMLPPVPTGQEIAAQNAATQAQSQAASAGAGVPPVPGPPEAAPAAPEPEAPVSRGPQLGDWFTPGAPPPPPVEGAPVSQAQTGYLQQPVAAMASQPAVTITVHQPQAAGGGQTGYLQQQPQPDPTQAHRETAADLLAAGFDPGVVDAAHRKYTGASLFGGMG